MKISFDFDEITQQISNIQIDNSIPKRKLRIPKIDIGPMLEVDEHKLILSDSLVELLQLKPGDRVSVEYYTENNQLTFPLIGRSECFNDKNGGCKLNKSNTVMFKGVQNDVLHEYGSVFSAELFKNCMYKLIPCENLTASNEVKSELIAEEQELKEIEQFNEQEF